MSESPERISISTTSPSEAILSALSELVPGVFQDGVVDVQRLSELTGLELAGTKDGHERFGLMWSGKNNAVRALQAPSMAALAPESTDSANWDVAENVFIEGDNLEVLKLLQKAYNDQVKLIYIDPPYNTGNDFVYKDDFSDPLKHYLEVTGQMDSEGNRLVANTEVSGRKHSNWLSMMYPRLVLARNLLREDGVIAVSIDYNESSNLKLILDEIFGPQNLIGEVTVIRAEGGGMAKHLVQAHDSLYIYARNIGSVTPLLRPKDIRGKQIEIDNVEYWIEEDWLRREFGKYGTLAYEEILEVKGQAFLDEVDKKIASGEYVLLEKKTKSGGTIVGRLRRLDGDGSKFSSVLKFLNKDGKARLEALGLADLFDFPKPVGLVQSLVLGATFFSRKQADIVMDFFAGSGTTADAVIGQNALDGGNTRYVLVNLPEKLENPVEIDGFAVANLADVTRLRIKKSYEDYGIAESVRNLTLAQSNFVNHNSLGQADSLLFESTLQQNYSDDAVAAEVLLKQGVRLDYPWVRVAVDDISVVVSDGVAVVLARKLTDDICNQVLALDNVHTVVFLEDAFAGKDAIKANAHFAFKQANKTMKTI